MVMPCIVNCSNPLRALGIVDALHVIAGYVQGEQAIMSGDDYFLRPFAVVEIVPAPRRNKPNMVPCPFEPELLLFTSYKVRGAHDIAVTVLKKMGFNDVILMEHSGEFITKRKWRGHAVLKKKLFDYEWDGSSEDDGYHKALQAMNAQVPADWEFQRIKTRDEILERFDERLKNLSRQWFAARGPW